MHHSHVNPATAQQDRPCISREQEAFAIVIIQFNVTGIHTYTTLRYMQLLDI